MKQALHLLFAAVLCVCSFGASAQWIDGDLADDFTVTDIDGNTHNLYTYLNAGKTVFMDISATWCGPCWSYHQAGTLETLYEEHGPTGTISQDVIVIWVEGDASTPVSELTGGGSSQGDWTAGVNYPIVDDTDGSDLASQFKLSYYPTVYKICPDRKTDKVSTALSASDLYGLVGSCGTVGATANDLQIGFNASTVANYCGNPDVKVKLQNIGTNVATTATVEVTDGGTVIGTLNWTGNLATGASELVTISCTPINDNFTATINITSSDDNMANNSTTHSFTKAPVVDLSVTLDATMDGYASEFGFSLIAENVVSDIYSGDFIGTWGNPNSIENMLNYNGTEYGTVNSLANNASYNNTWTLSAGCHTFMIYDSYGDGLLSGGVDITSNGTTIYSGAAYGSGVNVVFDAQPASACNLAVTASGTNVSTNGGNDGTATANATGATGTVSYAWSNGGNTMAISNLTAGTYTVTATDDLCSEIATIVITEPAAPGCNLVVSATGTNVTTNGGNDGTATATVTGETGTVSYVWSNAANTAAITNLTAGTYTVTATDDVCSQITTVVITEPVLGCNLVASATGTNVTTNGGNDGSATASVTGETGAVSYAWSNAANTSAITNLTAGTYTVTATDDVCSSIASVVITEPAAVVCDMVLTGSATDETCGDDNGTASVSVSAGNGGTTYEWSTGENGDNISNLSVGTYMVTATDVAGCTEVATVVVGGQDQNTLSVSITTTDMSSCGAGDASATASAFGGNGGPYTYSWTNYADNSSAGNTAAISGLGLGYYVVAVSDGDCTFEDGDNGFLVQDPGAPNVTMTASQVTCFGDTDGSVDVVATGNAPFTYNWTVSDGTTTSAVSSSAASLTNVAAGTYIVSVTDANGCVALDGGSVQSPDELTGTVDVVNPSTVGGSNGTASVTTDGGNGGESYAWSNGGTGSSISGLAAGNYNVVITDGNGCETTVNFTVLDGPLGISSLTQGPAFTIFPNPNNGTFTVKVTAGSDVVVYNMMGQVVAQEKITSSTVNMSIEADNGVYLVKVINGNTTQMQRVTISK